MDFYHIVYPDGDEEDLSEDEMDTVVANCNIIKKVVTKVPIRKKVRTIRSKQTKRPVIVHSDDDSKDGTPAQTQPTHQPKKKQRIVDDDDISQQEDYMEGVDSESDSDAELPEVKKKLTTSKRASPRKKFKSTRQPQLVDSDSDVEFKGLPKASGGTRVSTRKRAQRKPIVEVDSDEDLEEHDESEESFAAKSDDDEEDNTDDDDDLIEEDEKSDVSVDDEPISLPKKKTKPVPKTKTAPSTSWGFLDGKQAPKPVPKKILSVKQKSTDDTPGAGRSYGRAAYAAGDDLPIISVPQDMFDDMISNTLTKGGKRTDLLISLLRKLHKRPLRVATMCSGTESPILALDMITNSIEDFCRVKLKEETSFDHLIQIEHVFSCEIEPFKQAYIERNFQPPLLFRDIRELGNDQAYTAYGSLANVPNTPGCVDMLVAGTSCVDYSNLNVKQVR